MMVVAPYLLTPLPSHSPRSSISKSPKSFSHLVVAKDVFAHPLPPLIRSHSELSTMHKKCFTAFHDPFAIVLALYSNGLPHDIDDVDELWLVPNIVPQRVASTMWRPLEQLGQQRTLPSVETIGATGFVMDITLCGTTSIVHEAIGAIRSAMDVALYDITSNTNQSLSMSLTLCRRPLKHKVSIVVNKLGEVMEHFLHVIESYKWERIEGGRGRAMTPSAMMGWEKDLGIPMCCSQKNGIAKEQEDEERPPPSALA